MAKESTIALRVNTEYKAGLQRAADLHGMDLSEYILHFLDIGIETAISRKKQIRELAKAIGVCMEQ